MQNEYKIGDIVRLKSGGPKMTVIGIGDGFTGSPDYVHTRWFGENSKLESGSFKKDTVQPA